MTTQVGQTGASQSKQRYSSSRRYVWWQIGQTSEPRVIILWRAVLVVIVRGVMRQKLCRDGMSVGVAAGTVNLRDGVVRGGVGVRSPSPF
jgi:hypothetical protein